MTGGCCHSAEQGPRVRHQGLPRVKIKSDANSSRVEVRQKSSQRMDDDSSLKRFLKGIKNVQEGWKMVNKEGDLQGFQRLGIEKGTIP